MRQAAQCEITTLLDYNDWKGRRGCYVMVGRRGMMDSFSFSLSVSCSREKKNPTKLKTVAYFSQTIALWKLHPCYDSKPIQANISVRYSATQDTIHF